MKRATAGTRTFYHFTPPFNLPSIIKNGIYPFSDQHGNAHMLPGAAAIWLTANPNGNQVTEAHLAYYRKCGKMNLIADYETGRQRWMFGCNEGRSARITVRLPKNFRGLANYIELLTANYRESTQEIVDTYFDELAAEEAKEQSEVAEPKAIEDTGTTANDDAGATAEARKRDQAAAEEEADARASAWIDRSAEEEKATEASQDALEGFKLAVDTLLPQMSDDDARKAIDYFEERTSGCNAPKERAA
ncbi:MAG: hypothetical protein WCB70_22035 [Xanthobacteraceae bacterium]